MLGISIDPTETSDRLRRYQAKYGFPWDLVKGNSEVMLDYGIRSQATMVALNSSRTIVQRTTYDMQSDAEWQVLFRTLLASER